uniref:1-phosphatidylinositol-3-phosphate 5-kinase n=3 Tax=Rhizophora mucronata TaxID=61149 RepID=A0A2P2MG65_RHIMU
MVIPDSSLLDLLEKVKSWISWGSSDLSPSCFSREFDMTSNGAESCCECDAKLTEFSKGYNCQSCGKWFCVECNKGYESPFAVSECKDLRSSDDFDQSTKFCRFCNGFSLNREVGRKKSEKVHPSESPPRKSPKPPSLCFSRESNPSDYLSHFLESRDCGNPPVVVNSSMSAFSTCPSPASFRRTPSRSDEEEAEDFGKHFYSPSREYFHDISDIDTSSVSARLEFYNCNSVGSSPLHSSSGFDFSSYRVGDIVQQKQEGSSFSENCGPFDQQTVAVLKRPDKGTEDPGNTYDSSADLSIQQNQCDRSQKPLDFESNGRMWFPPPPEDENDEAESDFFTYDDDDDDVGESGAMFSSSSSLSKTFPPKEKQNEGNKESLRAVIQGHFRALVSQLLQGEDIKVKKEGNSEDWLDIVTTMAWQAANFVKPDTSRGGSMDPGDYVKVKCIATGSPGDSTFVKGIVCTKKIKHKRMTTQYKNPRLLLLGGALEFQSVAMASFNTLVQQENDHLKMIISKIEALRPNVLLVEKSVSPCALEYLLAKEISLVLNVKKPLLERIARSTGALISPSIDDISTTRLGHCELFHVERVYEEHENVNQFNKRPSRTLMFFEGCPRRLGCTVLLRGTCREELKKVKHVFQYALFAAYHLSLETSFLADEGASLPKMTLKSFAIPETMASDNPISTTSAISCDDDVALVQDDGQMSLSPEQMEMESLPRNFETSDAPLFRCLIDCGNVHSDAHRNKFSSNMGLDTFAFSEYEDQKMDNVAPGMRNLSHPKFQGNMAREGRQIMDTYEFTKCERFDEEEGSTEYFSAADTHQSILVSFSSRCVLKGTVCERSRLLRIKFYGSFDKPLGRYLRDALFDQTSYCRSCKESAEAHVLCFTHQQGNLTINVRSLASARPPLPGERDGKIWMWHRCLRCAHVDGVPPATRRVVMSDAAWGLSFGKFLELSFSNHATANRVAPCGHSLQRDCLRFYGFGSMVAFFHYSPIDILNVYLPPSMLEFSTVQQEWIREEAVELLDKMETYYAELSNVLDTLEQKSKSLGSDANQLLNQIMELKDNLREERNDYDAMLQPAVRETSQPGQTTVDILELNRLRRALLIGSHVWDRQLYFLDSLLKTNYVLNGKQGDESHDLFRESRSDIACHHVKQEHTHDGDNAFGYLKAQESVENDGLFQQNETDVPAENLVHEGSMLPSCHHKGEEEGHSDGEVTVDSKFFSLQSDTSNLSEKIDSAWTGTDHHPADVQPLHPSHADGLQTGVVKQISVSDLPSRKRMMAPVRVHSFDTVLTVRERMQKVFPPPLLHLSTFRSFHASGDYRSMVWDPVANAMRTYFQTLSLEAQKLILNSTPSFISSASDLAGGARLLLPQGGHSDIVVGVYDDDPASIVSYALSSKEYEDLITDKSNENDGSWSASERSKEDSAASTSRPLQSFGSVDLYYIHRGSYASGDPSTAIGTLFMDSKRSPHVTISYSDDSSEARGNVKFSVTCYFARHFDSLRKKCCPGNVDFVRSMSRCQRWSAQGGKSNVYFAKSLDERFIIKQVKKTELESFEEFASQYFKYLTDSLSSGSPTCLAKILGIYQVTAKHSKGGKEMKMDFMVMENLFFNRSIARVYDLKGSARSRYNTDPTGSSKVLLDMNLVETLRTEPIFLGSKAKRSLERAIWNDTFFLTSVDVMDYSLLVGVDEERKELVLGIIDFMRQYTWDKQLETWVKASGILGGPKNASPTIISPKQYKKRFRKAMTSYFLTVPDQWSS